MLLKVGTAMMLLSVALAVVVAVVMNLSGGGEPEAGEYAAVEPLAAGAKEEPEREEFDPGQKLEIEREKPPEEPREEPPAEPSAEPREEPEPKKKATPAKLEPKIASPARPEPERAPTAEPEPNKTPPVETPPVETPPIETPPVDTPPDDSDERPKPSREEPESSPVETPPVDVEDWPEPSSEEVAAVEAPRYYAPRRDSSLALTVETIGLHNVPVTNASSQQALDQGVIHFPQSPMPWEEAEQKNVYLAGHRLGWPGTGSRLVFYNLDKLRRGDPIMVRDSLGNPYEYRVSEVFVVTPDAEWAVDPVRGRDMLTLQTCTFPDLLNRLIVRADRV